MANCEPALACKTALAEATALWPDRRRTSDGICSSPQHRKQNPTSDHDVGLAFDLSHDPANGCDAHALAELLIRSDDPRVKYVISNSRIWNTSRDKPGEWRRYTGSNPHTLHVHVSVNAGSRNDTGLWWKPLLTDTPPAAPPVFEEDDDMAFAFRDAETKKVYYVAGLTKKHIPNRTLYDLLRRSGAIEDKPIDQVPEVAAVAGFFRDAPDD